jgi:hypothetical protein
MHLKHTGKAPNIEINLFSYNNVMHAAYTGEKGKVYVVLVEKLVRKNTRKMLKVGGKYKIVVKEIALDCINFTQDRPVASFWGHSIEVFGSINVGKMWCPLKKDLARRNQFTNVVTFWDVASCSPYVNRHFGGTYHFHLQGKNKPSTNHLLYTGFLHNYHCENLKFYHSKWIVYGRKG